MLYTNMKKTENQNSIQFRKNFIWNLLGTTVNAATSFIYMIIATRINGLEEAGVFSIAFSNACVLVVIGTYMGRTYQINDVKHSDKVFIQSRKITCLLMLLVCLGMIFIFQYSVEKSLIFLIWTVYKMLEAFSDVIYGVLHKNNRLDYVGQSLVLKVVLTILIFGLLKRIFRNLMWASLGAWPAALLIMIFWDYKYYKRYRVSKDFWSVSECRDILKEGSFICITALLSTYLVNASKYAIDMYGSDSMQAVYGILAMPATAMVLVGQYLIQPLLLKMSLLYRQKEKKAFIKNIFCIEAAIAGVGVFGIICAATIGIPILGIVYGVDLSMYRIQLVIVMIGALFYGGATVLTNVLTIMNKNRVQTACYALISVVVLLVSGTIVTRTGITGAVCIYAVSMMSVLVLLALVTTLKIKRSSF